MKFLMTYEQNPGHSPPTVECAEDRRVHREDDEIRDHDRRSFRPTTGTRSRAGFSVTDAPLPETKELIDASP